MKVYISGDTSGLPQTRFKFDDAEDYLKKNNHTPVNPFKIDKTKLAPWPVRMEVLASCDAIFLLCGWLNCNDSQIEKHYADILGKVIMFESWIETENREDQILFPIKGAIQEVTGLSFDQYTKEESTPGKRLHKCKPLGYFCRMIFSIQCQKAGLDAHKITRHIPRDFTSILHYLRKYDSEYHYNKDFKAMADSVNEKLYPAQDPAAVNSETPILATT